MITRLVNRGGIVVQGPAQLPPLYKYCKRQHMESLMQLGSLRVGSLSDYRRQEGRGSMVADGNEGTKRIDGYVESLNPQNRHLHPALGNLFGPGTNITGLTVRNVMEVAPDQLVFSAAYEYSLASHRRWFEQEGYDACYRIKDPAEFCAATPWAQSSWQAGSCRLPISTVKTSLQQTPALTRLSSSGPPDMLTSARFVLPGTP